MRIIRLTNSSVSSYSNIVLAILTHNCYSTADTLHKGNGSNIGDTLFDCQLICQNKFISKVHC